MLAIARREMAGHLRAPFTWVVLGLFALAAGAMYVQALNAYFDRSRDTSALLGGPVSVNLLLIRPYFLNMAIVVLFAVPVMTMRAVTAGGWNVLELGGAAMETPAELAAGIFLGQFGLYKLMLLTTVVDVAALYAYGRPEWLWLIGGYCGLLLMGGAVTAACVFVSSLASRRVTATVWTLGCALAAWAFRWVIGVSPSAVQTSLAGVSLLNRFDGFAKGLVDGGSVAYYLTFIGVFLLLTTESLRGRVRS